MSLYHWFMYNMSHSWLISRFVARVTRRVPQVEQELLTHLEHLSSTSVLSGVHTPQSLVFCVVFCSSLFVLLSLFLWPCIVCLVLLSLFLWPCIVLSCSFVPFLVTMCRLSCSFVSFLVTMYRLSFFDLQLLITPLISSNFLGDFNVQEGFTMVIYNVLLTVVFLSLET